MSKLTKSRVFFMTTHNGHSILLCFSNYVENYLCQKLIYLHPGLITKLNLNYVAWRSDPKAVAIDAFAISWTNWLFYAFPPFSLITRVLKKIREDSAEGILVVLLWETQPRFPLLIKMLVALPLMLPQDSNLLYLPYKLGKLHPLHKRLQLVACHLSGNHYRALVFQSLQPISLATPGGQVQKKQYKIYFQIGIIM